MLRIIAWQSSEPGLPRVLSQIRPNGVNRQDTNKVE